MGYIDTHAHIDFPEYQENFSGFLDELKQNNVEKVIIPGVNIEDTPRIINLINDYDMLFGAIGVHPSEAQKWDENSLDYLLSLKDNKKIVAIGEIGLDYYWDKSFIDLQQDIFRKQIELAKELKLPIIIHDREAHADTFKILKETNAKETGVLMHCFSGSVELMKECIKEDYRIALGGTVTFKNAVKPKEVAKAIPLEFLMLETDSPYMTPVPFRGQTNSPKYLNFIAQEIANLKNINAEEIIESTTKNAKTFFNL